MRILNANSGCRAAAVVVGLAVFFAVAVAHATIRSRTADALANNPNGGPGLVQAIADIFDGYGGKREIIARAILASAAGATDEQLAALGQALADHAEELASSDPAAADGIAKVVADAKNAQLQESFQSARARGAGGGVVSPGGLVVPSGGGAGGGGGLDVSSAS